MQATVPRLTTPVIALASLGLAACGGGGGSSQVLYAAALDATRSSGFVAISVR
jgi:hypothetical protein